MSTLRLTPHAARACTTRDLPTALVLAETERKLAEAGKLDAPSAAVYVGHYRAERGALIGSNGDCVVAIVRGGAITTVMLRRSEQPRTPTALDVSTVL